MLLPALARAKSKAQSIQCMNNIKQLNLALIMYANDHGDKFPPADQWCDLIKPYTGGSLTVYHCAAENGQSCSYAFNANLGNRKLTEISSPAQSVLIFSSAEGWNESGGPETATPHRHSGNALSVGFADGHTEITRAGRGTLRWRALPERAQ
jgi:prepilin-type processing-associated H-X9-DG protein